MADMESVVTFTVLGKPAPQGSKRYVGNGRMVEASKHLEPWRMATRIAAMEAMRASRLPTYTGPVDVHVHYTFAISPSSRGRTDGMLHAIRPDLDKLLRATLDGITGVVIDDDSRVANLSSRKTWTTGEQGAQITVMFLGLETT